MTTERSPADAEGEHQEAFSGTDQQWGVELVDRVRNNDPSLKYLDLCWGDDEDDLSDEELHWTDMAWELLGRYIAANTHLERLNLPLFVRDISLLFNNLTGSSSLRKVGLVGQQFGLDGILSMVPFFKNSPNLSEIDFDSNENINSECFEAVVNALGGGPVEILDFGCCNINDIAALENVTLPHLRALNLQHNSIERVPSLVGFTSLKELWIGGNRIGNDGCKEIAKLLRNARSTLKLLDLEHNCIGDEGAKIITDSLKSNNTLMELWLYGNELGDAGWGALLKLMNDVSSVKATLASNHTLTHRWERTGPFEVKVTTKMEQQIENASKINERYKGNANAASRAKVIATQLNSNTRRELCDSQGVEYSYGSIFAGIDPILLPDLLALASGAHGQTSLYMMLVATAPDLALLLDRKSMLKDAIKTKSSQIAEYEQKAADLAAEYKREAARITQRNADLTAEVSDLNKRLKSLE